MRFRPKVAVIAVGSRRVAVPYQLSRARHIRAATVALGLGICVFASAPSSASAATFASCPFFGQAGDQVGRGFYVSGYSGVALGQVTLRYGANTAGTYNITLTARSATYDGPIIGAPSASVVLAANLSADVPVTFNFGPTLVTQGSTIAFSQSFTGPSSSKLNYDTGTGPCTGITETNGTTPPLDTFRNNSVGLMITGPVAPTSTLTVPGCSPTGVLAGTVTADTSNGTTPKALHFKVDGGAAQMAMTSGSGAASMTIPEGTHSVEYWGEDSLGQLESPHHTASVVVDKTAPTLTVTSDQGKTVYNAGDKASVTTKASDAGSGLATDPSGAGQPLSTLHAASFSITKTATDKCGNSTTAAFNYKVLPVDTRPALSPNAFVAALKGPAIIGRKTGTTVSYSASDAGKTTFAVFRATQGVKVGKSCAKPRRGGHGKRCTRLVRIKGSFSHTDVPGRNRFTFTGRVGGKTLARGNYRLVASPTVGALTGPAVTRDFRIKG